MPSKTRPVFWPRRQDPVDEELRRYQPTLEEEIRDCLEQMRHNEMLFSLEVEEDLIDQRIYERKALLCRYHYLQAKARALGLRAIL